MSTRDVSEYILIKREVKGEYELQNCEVVLQILILLFFMHQS